MPDKEYFPLDTIDAIIKGTEKGNAGSTTIRLEDANTESARVLIPELGSDDEFKREGRVDWRRFGHNSELDPYWMAHFTLKSKYRGGRYSKSFVEQIGNLNYSINGRHKKITVDMQGAVSGKSDTREEPKKKRGIMDRLLGRNKEEPV